MSYYSDRDNLPEPTRKRKLYHRHFSVVDGPTLDLGCSTGNFIQHAPDRIVGLDIDRDALRVARSRGFRCALGDAVRGLPFDDGTFRAVNCDSVLEHVHEPLGLLRELRRVLTPGGKLIVITPNIYRVRHRFWRDYTHVRPFCAESLERVAYDAGFSGIEVRRYALQYLKPLARLSPGWERGHQPFWWLLEDAIGMAVATNLMLEATA
jgi:SAM-dependent methyltransferase